MEISIDNLASAALIKLDNELCPFHLSISCWALVAFDIVDLLAGLKRLNAQGASPFHIALIEAVGVFAVLLLLRYRLAQTALLKSASHIPLPLLKTMSSAILGAVGVCLAGILFGLIA